MSALLAVLLASAAAAQAAPRRATVVFVDRASVAALARVPGASVGLMSLVQGRYDREQALLDMGQGARTAAAAYRPRRLPAIAAVPGRIAGWGAVVRRARAAPAEIEPGLLAGAVPGGAAFAGAPRLEAVAAADRGGRFARAGAARLVVRVVPDVAALGRLVRARTRGVLVLAIATPPAGAAAGAAARLAPVAAFGLGGGRELTSTTTRTDGVVAAIDVAPTVLAHLAVPTPAAVRGEPMRLTGRPADVAGLDALRRRLGGVGGRRLGLFVALVAAWAALAALLALVRGRRGARRGVRAGALAVLWVPALLLASAALGPAAAAEEIGVALAALALGALTDAAVRWPRAPVVPCLAGVAAYVVDLAFGSPLIQRSILGPNPAAGARFYGIGNELEAVLPVLALVGVAAALGGRGRSRGTAAAFAAAGVLLAAAIGPAALGADVGGVLTVGGGTAVAVLLALPGRLSRRRVALAVVAPVAALAALALADLATGGNGHFTRTVLRADSSKALGDVLARRYELAWGVLRGGAMPVLTPLALVLVALAVRRRNRLLAAVPGAGAWQAALGGAAAAGVVGALVNDSGPILLVFAVAVAGAAAGYIRAPNRATG